MKVDRPRIVVLTGAGVSAESGIATFRDSNGLWKNHRIEDVASPTGYARTPELVHEFYDARRRQALETLPNAAHYALADLARELRSTNGRDGVMIVTQNVDDLHEQAGSRDVIHLHGQLNSALCTSCGQRHRWEANLEDRPQCPSCGARSLRPDIVWFGESVHRLREVQNAVDQCEALIVVGTSGSVSPASGLVGRARASGARTVLVNAEPWADLSHFDQVVVDAATVGVPEVVKEILDLDFDPDEDWSETSAELQRVSVYIDIESALADRPFVLGGTRGERRRLPGLMPGARDAVRHLARDFNVVLVASDKLAESSDFLRFRKWYETHFGSYRGHLASQLLIAGNLQAVRGWDFFVQGDGTMDGPPDWVGKIVRFGPKGLPTWPTVVDHIHASAWERIAPVKGSGLERMSTPYVSDGSIEEPVEEHDFPVRWDLEALTPEQRRELAIRADTVRGLMRDRDPGPGQQGLARRGGIGSRTLAARFSPTEETESHIAALLLGLDEIDAKWLYCAGIPTDLFLQIAPLASQWLAHDRSDPDWLNEWAATLEARFGTAQPTAEEVDANWAEVSAWGHAIEIVTRRPWLMISWVQFPGEAGHLTVHDGAFGASLHFDNPDGPTLGGPGVEAAQLDWDDLSTLEDASTTSDASYVDWVSLWGAPTPSPAQTDRSAVFTALRSSLIGANLESNDGYLWVARPAAFATTDPYSAYDLVDVFPTAQPVVELYADMLAGEYRNSAQTGEPAYWHEPLWVVHRAGLPVLLFDEAGQVHMPSSQWLERARGLAQLGSPSGGPVESCPPASFDIRRLLARAEEWQGSWMAPPTAVLGDLLRAGAGCVRAYLTSDLEGEG